MKIEVEHIAKENLEPLEKEISIIKCGGCNQDIIQTVTLLNIKKDPPDRYQFICHCNSKTFVYTYKYKTLFNPINCKIQEIKEENGKWVAQLKN